MLVCGECANVRSRPLELDSVYYCPLLQTIRDTFPVSFLPTAHSVLHNDTNQVDFCGRLLWIADGAAC